MLGLEPFQKKGLQTPFEHKLAHHYRFSFIAWKSDNSKQDIKNALSIIMNSVAGINFNRIGVLLMCKDMSLDVYRMSFNPAPFRIAADIE